MYGSPFCYHEFSAEELAEKDVVKCACGHTFKSSDLSEFSRINKVIAQSNRELGALVQQMASFNSAQGLAAAAAAAVQEPVAPPKPVKPPKPARPKRERPKLSVTQWLIVTAGFMVLVAASIFVSNNLSTWSVQGWATLEIVLGAITAFGAIRLKKFSELFSNFLAVFSSAMLLTFIMTVGTVFGWGFNYWTREPSWFWCLNLAVVGGVSLFLGSRTKNFGWRAVAPLSVASSALVFASPGAVGFEDKWRTTILSIAMFATLIVVRISRNSKNEVSGKGDEAVYLKDLVEREDNALKRFGLFAALLLGGSAAISLLLLIVDSVTSQIDSVSVLVLAAVWLGGARLNRSWIGAIFEKDETVFRVRNVASGLGLSALGVSVVSFTPAGGVAAQVAALAMVALAIGLERYAKILLLPASSVTAASAITGVYGLLWSSSHLSSQVFSLGNMGVSGYLLILGALGLVREFNGFQRLRSVAWLMVSLLGGFALIVSSRLQHIDSAFSYTLSFSIALALVQVTIYGYGRLLNKAFGTVSRLVTVASSVATVISILLAFSLQAASLTFGYFPYSIGYLVVSLLGAEVLKQKFASAAGILKVQAYGVILIQLLSTLPYNLAPNDGVQKTGSVYMAITGILLFLVAALRKDKGLALVGYLYTNLNILFIYFQWVSGENVSLLSVVAILTGGITNVGLIYLQRTIEKPLFKASSVTLAFTALSLLAIEVPLLTSYAPPSNWVPIATLAGLAIVLGFGTKSSLSYAYAAGSSMLALAGLNFYNYGPTVIALQNVIAQFVLVALATRVALKSGNKQLSAIPYLLAGVLGAFIALTIDAARLISWSGPELYSLVIALTLVGAALLLRRIDGVAGDLLLIDIPVAVATLPSLLSALTNYGSQNVWELRFFITATILWLHNLWRARNNSIIFWKAAAYLTGIASSVAFGIELGAWTGIHWTGIEPFTLLIAGSTLVVALVTRSKSTYSKIEVPVLVALVPSMLADLSWMFGQSEFRLRFAISALILFALNIWRLRSLNEKQRLNATLLTAIIAGLSWGWVLDPNGTIAPESSSFSIALLVLATGLIAKHPAKLGSLFKIDIPVAIAAVPSLIAGLANVGGYGTLRFLVAAAILYAHNLWRLRQANSKPWLAISSVTGVLFALSLANEVNSLTRFYFHGPEIYSVLVTAVVLVQVRFAKRLGLLEGTLVSTGLPLAVVLTPTATYTWGYVTTTFSSLQPLDIARTIAFILAALATLVFGLRRGNLGAYVVGTFELWLVAVPALWFNTNVVVDGSLSGEFRGLIVAGLIFWLISILRRYEVIKAKSVVYIGIPAFIALAPAILDTLTALGSGGITTVGWWRFSIVLGVSLALLVIGALAEVGGAFFPGLIGVVITVLPYGFHPTTNKEWFLWVILLAVAGLLVWLAIRLEGIRKQGREPATWIRELK